MIEFSEDLSKQYSGMEAVRQRVTTRLSHTTVDIPYYDKGVDLFEFTYGSKDVAIRMGLRDFGPVVKVNEENARVQVYNVEIDVNNLIQGED